MSNHKIVFFGTAESKSEYHELTTFINQDDDIFISINMGVDWENSWICLDKTTAIKFAKTLRTEINKID